MVNLGQNLLSKWNRTCFVTESVDLVGLDYLWEAVLSAPDSVGHKPIELMKDIYTNLSTKLPQEQVHIDGFWLMLSLLYNTNNCTVEHTKRVENDSLTFFFISGFLSDDKNVI